MLAANERVRVGMFLWNKLKKGRTIRSETLFIEYCVSQTPIFLNLYMQLHNFNRSQSAIYSSKIQLTATLFSCLVTRQGWNNPVWTVPSLFYPRPITWRGSSVLGRYFLIFRRHQSKIEHSTRYDTENWYETLATNASYSHVWYFIIGIVYVFIWGTFYDQKAEVSANIFTGKWLRLAGVRVLTAGC